MEASANPNNLSIKYHIVKSIIDFRVIHADPSEEKVERLFSNKKNTQIWITNCGRMSRFETSLGTYWSPYYYDIMVDWEKQAQELKEKGYSMTTSTSRNTSRDKKGGKVINKSSHLLNGYKVGYTPCFHSCKNPSPSACQLINHPEAFENGEWVGSASYKKCNGRI